MEKKRTYKKRTPKPKQSEESIAVETGVKPAPKTKAAPVVKDKAYFKAKMEALAEEMRIAIKADRSLSIRLKSIYNNVNRDASKL